MDNSDVVCALPNLTIDLIIGLPTYETINSNHLNLNQNATSINSNLGDGLSRILHLTISAVVYNTLLTIPFVAPTNPGPHAIITVTAIQIASTAQVHTNNMRICRECQSTDKALKQLLLGAIGDIYTSANKHQVTGYVTVTTR